MLSKNHLLAAPVQVMHKSKREVSEKLLSKNHLLAAPVQVMHIMGDLSPRER